MIDAKYFHPMRGHCVCGEQVIFSNGEIITLEMDGMFWAPKDKAGKILARLNGAYDLSAWIVSREGFDL